MLNCSVRLHRAAFTAGDADMEASGDGDRPTGERHAEVAEAYPTVVPFDVHLA